MTKIFESNIEEFVIELLQAQGFEYLPPEDQENERHNLSTVIFRDRLGQAVDRINSKVPSEAREQALKQVYNLPSQNLIDNNEAFHLMLTDGIEVEYMGKDGVKGDKVYLIDFENIENNEFLVCNQFTVLENNTNKRPDVVLFVNGLPVVVVELKNPADENATVRKAFTQLQNYKRAIPTLFHYNSILVASDGLDAKTGTISSDYSRFIAWKSADGFTEDKQTIPQIETLIRGMLRKTTLLDLIRHFIVFEKTKKEDLKTGLTSIITVKKIAAYHQYFAVNKAIDSTLAASSEKGNRKAGVVWHTQGSGKSLSMVFYAGKTVLELNNPTVVFLTDINDLYDQHF